MKMTILVMSATIAFNPESTDLNQLLPSAGD